MTPYPGRIDEQLRPHPCADALQAAHPSRQWSQPAAKCRGVPEGTLDLRAQSVQRLTIGMLEQVDGVQPVRTLVVLARSRTLRLAKRGQQLIALREGPVVQIVRIIFAIRQQVAPAMQLPNQTLGDFLLTDVHGGDLPGVRQGVRRPNCMQFIAFGPAPPPPSPARIGIFTVVADPQWLALHKGHEGRRSAPAQALLDGPPTNAGADRIDPSAHGRLRGDGPRPQGRRAPIGRVTSPADGAIMEGSPQQGGDHHPGLQLHILLLDLQRHLLQGVVQYRPEFAFHSTAPFWRFGQETPAEAVPKTRTPFISTPSNILERCCPVWERWARSSASSLRP